MRPHKMQLENRKNLLEKDQLGHPSRISRGPLCPRYIRRINVRTPETKRQGTTAHHGAEDTERKDKRKTRHWKVRVSSR
ncbi:uncharacterized protein LOC105735541 isoform X5 [Apis florea]|uniref:uncharacterized protein LOC105735541 isoform X5 n=1 Tax=Apis florea TaxID=7463 RepID=UPI0012FF59C0|nr:uncharacterized protein LOC105735541 isoform X5 [Apis florea]